MFVINGSKLIQFAQNGLVSLSLCREARPCPSESEQCPLLLSRPRSLRETHTFLRLPFALCWVRQCDLPRSRPLSPPASFEGLLSSESRLSLCDANCVCRSAIGSARQAVPLPRSSLAVVVRGAQTLCVRIIDKPRPLISMRRDVINVSRLDEAAFLRALPAIRLLRQPMSLDGFPNWRFVPRATYLLRFVLSRALRSTSGSSIDAEGRHANCLCGKGDRLCGAWQVS